ncbi:E3 ubiquitin-protein ligase UBR1 [Anopheles maculipalpis]|uniref:E3 ubiquitin-protein ligase UBR1 n=1 Tax=Anopheles maculipalpis TaxID=1496333 RepID=UPI0021599D3F|nr:E3 ubiquitin-protein ligase UBR1 [Anopheles maculipalpis]
MNLNRLIQQWEERHNDGLLTPEVLVFYLQSIAGNFVSPTSPRPEEAILEEGAQLPNLHLQVAENDAHGNNIFLAGNAVFDEPGARAATVSLMERFICGSDPEEFLDKIKHTDTVSSVCGRVFKIGEPTYSCRECSMDPTCVLCSTCFKKSVHRTHKYKMATSCGGGCCDCGDVEAWKRFPVCDEHACISDDKAQDEQQQVPLSDDKKKRCGIVFRAILDYCMQTLQMHGTGNLPEWEDDENTHCTILYNDETHTFEQVIQTLTSIVKCEHKTAIEYVTSIDREGRAVVKCASFEVCKKLKEDIENKAMRTTMASRTLPLKVTVMHRNEVACQHLAMQMLAWFQEFLTKHSSFRKIFTETVTKSGETYNLRFILSNDQNLWKSARTSWHRLLIAGMLMDYDNKKLLAITFTKLYASLMQDFIRDDHYHSFSIVSLSVQLFTVPTIAHYLIEKESAFFKLLHTYCSEAIDKYVKNRQLVFIKNTSTMNAFKRASYILIDLKYLLSFKPDKWTNELRTGFVHGLQQLIRLLKYMQGMDAATRQVGQHLEYEQEWETAFTLHLKLSPLITLVLEWCATDRIVLGKVFRMVMSSLSDTKFIAQESETVVRTVGEHSASCLTYDVLSRPVSVHLPLTRFLAGLYAVFERHDFTFDAFAPNTADYPTPEQIIEPVLCARTMISQVHAGMWRRNGYALINQLFFYRNVKCRYEMLDRDIVILQIGASLIEANKYIIHVLNKYKLLEWLDKDVQERPRNAEASDGDDDYIRQIGVLVEEFLELLIVVIGERYVPGVGDVSESDRIKKEIVQQLCIKPHSHSELSRALNEDNCSEIMFESVIDDVAVFEKPNDAEKRGMYSLKQEYYSWYNLYFYHYSKEDKSKSEERQRNQKKEKNELVCCPPPALPKLTQLFNNIPNLLQCDVMLKIIQAVLGRALDLQSMTFTEGQLQRVLHLIGYAIQEEESGHYPFMRFYERSQFINLLTMLEDLSKSPRVESLRDLLRWTIQRYKAMEAKHLSLIQGEIDRAESSGSGLSSVDADRLEKEERAKLAAKRRAQVMAQMQKAQQMFMTTHPDMFENEGDEKVEQKEGEPAAETDMDWQTSSEHLVALGPKRTPLRPADTAALRYSCILCSEKTVLGTYESVNMVYAAFVQRSSVLSRYTQTDERGILRLIETETHPSPHLTTCGHVMHSTCFDKYFNNEVIKENRRPYRNRTPILFDIEKNEFLCPLCRFLSNCLLPLLPPHETITSSAKARVDAAVKAAGFNEIPESPVTHPNAFNFSLWYTFTSDFMRLALDRVEQTEYSYVDLRTAIRRERRNYDRAMSYGEPEHQPMSLEQETAEYNIVELPAEGADQMVIPPAQAARQADEEQQEQDQPQQEQQQQQGAEQQAAQQGEEQTDDDSLDGYETNDQQSTEDEVDYSDDDMDWIRVPPSHLTTTVLKEAEPKHGVRLRYYGTLRDPPLVGRLFDRTIKYSLLTFAKNVRSFTTVPYKAKRFAEYLTPWVTLSYTIKSIEMQLRVLNLPLGTELSIRYSTCLRGLVRAACAMGPLVPTVLAQHKMLLFMADIYETLYGHKPSQSFFDWDLFGLLNTCLFTTRTVLYSFVRPQRIPKGDALDHSIVLAIFMVNMLRTIITSVTGIDPPPTASSSDAEQKSPAQEKQQKEEDTATSSLTDAERNLLLLYQQYNIHQPHPDDKKSPLNATDDRKAKDGDDIITVGGSVAEQKRLCQLLVNDIKTQSHTLLRCCCLLFYGITDITLPQCTDVPEQDYHPMMTYLDLQEDPLVYLDARQKTFELIERLAFCNSDQINRMRYARQAHLLGEPKALFQAAPPVRRLIDLPEDYSDLINSVSLFTCPNNIRDDSRNPTMCLVCGVILCSQSFCCQKELDNSSVGSCTYHTAECGAGIGIFLRIRDAEILLLGINKGCFIPAPYVDEYGETDQGLRRGNPLRLSMERYQKLYHKWLSHGLHEEITRRNEQQHTMFATQWQNL